MGLYDQPANIDMILAVTGAEKVTYVGYSQGTSQMFYGLGNSYDYYESRINRFVGVASAVMVRGFDYDGFNAVFKPIIDLGVYTVGGENAQ